MEESLRKALSAVGLSELPKIYKDGMGYWFRAIGVVKKLGGATNYALLERDGYGLISVKKDFGYMIPIFRSDDKDASDDEKQGLVAVYPYAYLDEQRYCANINDDELVREYGVDRIKNASDEEKAMLIRCIGIREQKARYRFDLDYQTSIQEIQEIANAKGLKGFDDDSDIPSIDVKEDEVIENVDGVDDVPTTVPENIIIDGDTGITDEIVTIAQGKNPNARRKRGRKPASVNKKASK